MNTRTHVFAIAVETYQKTKIPRVDHAENDAQEFVKAWEALGVDPTDCVTLLSAHATKTAIESSLKRFLNGVQKDSAVVFFYAGHGFAENDSSYLTAHDTQPGDYPSTSISLGEILTQLRKCKSERTLLFLDSCHSGLPTSTGMRSVTGNFSDEEMRRFCSNASHHVGFAACGVAEYSWSSPSLKHGIWSYCVINALSGKAKDALDKGTLVTSDSLRDYLAQEVPRLLRSTRSGNETQTPCCFGNATKQFIVADLAQILADTAAKANSLGSALKEASLRGKKFGKVRNLIGFKRGDHDPRGHDSATEIFVKKRGSEDVKSQADAICDGIRATFGYKRKDVLYNCCDGRATIKTPDFDVNLWIEQDADEESRYVITTEIGAIRRPAVIMEDGFNNLFSRYCDTVVIDFSRGLNIQDKIDEIEGISQLEKFLDYEPDCSSFSLELPQPSICINVTAYRMTLSLPGVGNLKVLLANSQNALAALSGNGLILLLPETTTP